LAEPPWTQSNPLKKSLDTLRQKFQTGLDFHRQGKLSSAAKLYEEIILDDKEHFGALHFLGVIYGQNRQFERAVELISKAIKIDQRNAEAYFNLGNVFKELRRFDDALANYDNAISLKRNYTEAYYNRGTVLLELSRFEDALASNDRAISLTPGFAEAYYNRGIAFLKLSRFEEALASNDQGIAIKLDYAEAYNLRGAILSRLHRLDEALVNFNRAIELVPDLADAYSNRGHTFMTLKRFDEAAANYSKAIELNPEIDFLIGSSLFAKMSNCDWSSFFGERENLRQKIEAKQRACAPFASLALFDSSELHRKVAECYGNAMCAVSEHLGPNSSHTPGDRIRIGYFSPDFREHPVSYLMAEMFELHDREKFEIVAFSFRDQQPEDAMRHRLRSAFDSFLDVAGKSDEEIVSLSRSLKIDIAVDLAGYTENSRPRIFAIRAAPIQVSYIGYLGTSGTKTMDYLISDRIIIPENSETSYSEKIAWLPSYQVNDSKRPVGEKTFSREDLGIPDNRFIFCCFNTNYKISPETFNCWMNILKFVDNGVLLLFSGNKKVEENLRREAQIRDVDPSRLIFAGSLPRDQYIARFRCTDLFLDTLPYNAGTTASDALWAGLPVLTCLGKAFAGRVCASVLVSIGLPDLITRTPEEFEARATELATQPEKLTEIRERLKANRTTTRLFNSRRFTNDLETAYLAMVVRHSNGLPPEHILLQAEENAQVGSLGSASSLEASSL